MTSPPNGTYGDFGGVIHLGDLSPETRTVTVVRDGKQVKLLAYVNGKRGLLERAVAVAAARRSWLDARAVKDADDKPIVDPETGRTELIPDPDGVYWTVYIASVLRAVIPDMTETEAIVLAFDGERATTLLEDLGWFRKTSDDEVAQEGEVAGEETLTGALSSPTSASTSTGAGPT